MVEVLVTEVFTRWFEELDEGDTGAVVRTVDLLAARGVTLPFPYSSDSKDSRYASRELCVQSRGKSLRILYAFDSYRQVMLLLGAYKTGLSAKAFYAALVPKAESLWEEYMSE